KYVRVNEWQKNGLGYHVHILFAGINYLPREWIARTWSKLEQSGWSIHAEKPLRADSVGAIRYLLKYMKKQLNNGTDSDQFPLSLVVNWALFLRTYSVRRNSFSSRENNSNSDAPEWEFIGVFPVSFCQLSADELRDAVYWSLL
ncbi:MAG: hypothetical protein QW429_05590, partial [Thermoprotei archaeon]